MRVIYFDLDSLRPDHLGCYGYGRGASPNIDRIAAQGICFDHCYVSDMPCMPSRTSLFSGMFGIHHGCVSHIGARAEPFSEGAGRRRFRPAWAEESWMRLLRNAGLRTVTFSSFAERHAAWHWLPGFQEIHDTGHFGHETADDVTPGVLDWLRTNGADDNWFLHVNLWDVHVPYRTPPSIGNRFAGVPLPDPWLSQEMIDAHRAQPGIRSARDALFLSKAASRPDLNPASLATPADAKLMVDAYDTAIHYADEHIGRILSALEALGVLGETAVIISADHGECLGELNAYGGHCFADACTARIPLVIRWPGVTDSQAGKRDNTLRYHIDLAATVSELVSAPIPASWDARSMAAAMAGTEDASRDHLVLSQLAQTCQRSVVFRHEGEHYLYLRTYRSAYYPLPPECLFNLDRDPHETRDLAPSHPALVNKAAALLDSWESAMLEQSGREDPLRTVLREEPEAGLETYVKRLEQTGRAACIAAVRERAVREQIT